SHNCRTRHVEARERSMDQVGLRFGSPDRAAWTLAMAKAWTVENDDAISFRGHVDEAAGDEVLHRGAIAMQQHERFAIAKLHVVEPNTIHIEEFPDRRIVLLGSLGEMAVDQGRAGQRSDNRNASDCVGATFCACGRASARGRTPVTGHAVLCWHKI